MSKKSSKTKNQKSTKSMTRNERTIAAFKAWQRLGKDMTPCGMGVTVTNDGDVVCICVSFGVGLGKDGKTIEVSAHVSDDDINYMRSLDDVNFMKSLEESYTVSSFPTEEAVRRTLLERLSFRSDYINFVMGTIDIGAFLVPIIARATGIPELDVNEVVTMTTYLTGDVALSFRSSLECSYINWLDEHTVNPGSMSNAELVSAYNSVLTADDIQERILPYLK